MPLSDVQKKNLHETFRDLFWPAVAGNVVWSLLTVVIQKSEYDGHVPARFLVLLLLSGYLVLAWLSTKNINVAEFTGLYWVWDGLHLAAIAVFAIAVQTKQPWLNAALVGLFTVTIAGHFARIWQPRKSRSWTTAIILGGCNSLGLLVLAIERCCSGTSLRDFLICQCKPTYGLFWAVLTVLVFWKSANALGVRSH